MLHGSKYLNSIIRIALSSALAAICGAAMPAALAQQSFTVTPTTTLSAETANNTSAPSSFAALSNGDIAPGNVSKLPTANLLYSGATTAVYAQFQPWFGQSSHINVGYSSDDPTQVRNQVTDMLSRGISGVIVDWYGPDAAVENNTTLLMKTAAENTNGAFVFAVQEDVGALSTCASTSGCNVTAQLISDLAYAYSNFEGSKAYMTFNGRPVLFFFGVDKYAINWAQVRSSVSGNPYFVFIGTSGMTHADADGYYSWVIIDTSNPDDESLSVLSTFYSGMQALPNDLAYGTSYIGFNESLAPWVKSNPRIMNQHCGQTWLDTFAAVGAAGYSAGKQLQAIQIITWNDYEEGTEIETGISNCLTISPAINGTQLQWSITGNEKAVDHYVVFISLDGQNLMNLASVANGTHTFNLSPYNLAPGTTYKFLVEAIGVPSVQNVMSASVGYLPQAQPPNAVLTLTTNSGTAPLTLTASTANSTSPNGNGTIANSTINFGDGTPAVSGPSAQHTYKTPGTFTVTATVTDNIGATASTTQKVTVSPATPTAVLTVTPSSGKTTLTVSASLTGSSSPDGHISSSTINFGDGTPTVAGPTASHKYYVPGNFTVTGTVIDNFGATASTTKSVAVSQGCKISSTNRSVTICSPAASSTVTSPVQIVAYATDSRTITRMVVYVNSTMVYHSEGRGKASRNGDKHEFRNAHNPGQSL